MASRTPCSLNVCFGSQSLWAAGWTLSLMLLPWSCAKDAKDPSIGPPTAGFMPAAPSAYTAKVKNLLTGRPPMDSELQAVTADPQALGGLIDQWMAQPE